VVPEHHVEVRHHATSRAHQLRRVGAQEEIAVRRRVGETARQAIRITAVVLELKLDRLIRERLPCL
jgi:hypothetical protein